MTPEPRPGLDHATTTGRRRGLGVRALGLVVPGVRRVQADVEPYADAWRTHNEEALRSPGRRWVVLGDSMSQAVGASSWDAGWVSQLAAWLEEAGHPQVVVNLSATGARSTDVLERQLPALASLPRADGTDRPDLVTVLVGSNDLFAGGAARRGLPDAFGELITRLPHGAVVATLPQPRAAARRANVHVRRAESEGLIEVVDMAAEGPSSWRGRLAADWFHPNDAGYTEIARAFLPHVLSVLRTT